MTIVTNSRARRWGTLLVLVGGLVVPIGTASAQDRGRENQRNNRRGDGHWDGSRHAGRDDGEEGWRWREAERVRNEARERLANEQSARLAAQESAHQEYLRRAAADRALREQARQEAVRAAQLRAQQQAFAREQARLEWERDRAAQLESWRSARQARRDARLARERRRLAWATVNQQVWAEQRGRPWTIDVQLFAGERNAVRYELRRHARRNAYLSRLRQVASEDSDPQILDLVDGLFAQEQRRHKNRMDRLGATVRPPYASVQMQ